jgi:hypothetical protein
MWGTLSDERTNLYFKIAALPRQRSQSRVRVSQVSWSYFTQVPAFISPQDQGGPVIPPGTEFRFRRLLRLAGLR